MTTFIFEVKNVPAALYKALGCFATNGVNMTKLESYQQGASFAATMFYTDIVGAPGDPALTGRWRNWRSTPRKCGCWAATDRRANGASHIDRLQQPDVTFHSVWDGDRLAAVGAIKALGDGRGELKSMRAHPDYRGKGAGKALLVHLLAVARERGYAWLGLETGTPEPFSPARGLYRAHGFSPCPPFADYVEDGFSQCMELRF
jgi:putative acetyltransferase